MAEISLSAYQNELERLLGENRYDEVIAHARHILKTQPKNLRAYQQLGDALVASGRWEEAGSLLRRALGAQPQDFRTHSQLARVFERLEQYDRAIWHAERALDQKPNDQETISLVRELYRVHRNEEIDRMQLSAAALTQQHIRANLLTEALDTLAAAMENNPQRIDLQLLRARALWLDGQRMDAAEAALDILDRLPYAIDANRIMTELWLTEQRPSDAQLYLKRIEDLDPYLAHQMATGEEAPETLLQLERLDYSAMPRENEIVNPEWLDNLGEARDDADESGGLGALLGIDEGEPAPAEQDVTADLDDLLSDEQLEDLFSELVIGEPVASVSEAPQSENDAEALLASMEEQGFIEPVAPAADASGDLPLGEEDADDDEGVVEFFAQASAVAEEPETAAPEDMQAGLDDDLAGLLERLDSSEEDGGWMAEIQGGSLELEAEDESLAYLDDFEREWVEAGQDDEAGGAPWLSAAMREAMDKNSDSELDLFGEDEQLQNLLKLDSDTEPLRLSDIEDWITDEPAGAADDAGESALDIDDDLLHSPPGAAWLEADEASGAGSLLGSAEADDPNQLNAELIDGWGAELGDDDDDDPYVDWLRDDPRDLGDSELRALSAPDDEAALATPDNRLSSAKEQARAWGLDDADQLADFVEDAGGDGAPDWLNAVVPGLDRENDASTDDVNEYARPMSSPGKEFAWVSDIVQEETGEMKAVDPDEAPATPYFRFSNPPAWLTTMQDRAAGTPAAVTAVTALSLDEDIDALDLDDLTFDDYFNFDTPTDKLDAISLDEDTQQLSFASLDWDDYFDLESPTEKTIAITLDEDAESLKYDAIGVDDADFDFEKAADETSAAGVDFDFDDIGLGDDLIADADQAAEAPPAWLNYDKPGAAATDDDPRRSRNDDQTTL